MNVIDKYKNIPRSATDMYWYENKPYPIYYYRFRNFQELMQKVFPNISRVRLFGTRSFTDGMYIYALDTKHWYSRIAHSKLLEHEVRHINGEKHTWYPITMNPFWIFRWFDR